MEHRESGRFLDELSIIFGWYLAASIATVMAYGFDKSAAERNRWRVKESTLHMLALLGGWPGAFIAQRVFRHKSRKPSFQVGFMITVIVNCALLVLFWRAGSLS
jgi:uncharacterized membrane protein YsdA (DUF1294 family)